MLIKNIFFKYFLIIRGSRLPKEIPFILYSVLRFILSNLNFILFFSFLYLFSFPSIYLTIAPDSLHYFMFGLFIRASRPKTPLIIENAATTTRVRSMTYLSVNAPDNTTNDPQALKNNPPIGNNGIRHKELHRTQCAKPDCSTKDCTAPCGPIVKTEAVGHGTHGASPAAEPDKTTVEVSQTDFNGKPKPQRMVMYKTPHKTIPTAEHVAGTQKLQTDPAMKKIIKDNETKS